jgi:metal-responsive CopG/Arc/MetJ family transcriptional regulator
MFEPKIRIPKDLYRRLTECAEAAGYASMDEFIRHVLEKEIERIVCTEADQEEIKRRLQGLGYLD